MSVEARIENALDTLKGKAFTLLDVSELVKADGGKFYRHSELKPIIENILGTRIISNKEWNSYTFTDITVSTPHGPAQARLFHTPNQGPHAYTRTAQQATGPQINPTTHISAPSITASSSHPTVTGRSVIKNRDPQWNDYVEVPKPIWEKANFKPGFEAVVEIHPESLTIYHDGPQTKYHSLIAKKKKEGAHLIVVPSSGRFRLAPTLLKQAKLDGETISFSQFTDKIVVTRKA